MRCITQEKKRIKQLFSFFILVEFTSVRVLMQRKDSDSAGETKDNTAGKQPIRSDNSI